MRRRESRYREGWEEAKGVRGSGTRRRRTAPAVEGATGSAGPGRCAPACRREKLAAGTSYRGQGKPARRRQGETRSVSVALKTQQTIPAGGWQAAINALFHLLASSQRSRCSLRSQRRTGGDRGQEDAAAGGTRRRRGASSPRATPCAFVLIFRAFSRLFLPFLLLPAEPRKATK
ncbi:uncharacterized protein LOC101701452 [Heterocephalus glaber]|uniref:Uncharacterized protein LOC101701452 n=1 Tax=Heterocephalus glaber TaxID=10181 RepID=A0AAX6SQ20_HETGA|nr:uncharacterized protein LOC101701452 [Heterocephalus glaber]